MSLSQATDEQILLGIEAYGSSGTDQLLTFSFSIGGVFFVQVFAGEDSSSDPAEVLESLVDYKGLGVELYYQKPMPPKEELRMEPIEIDTGDKVYKFEFNVSCFPHIAIDPSSDVQFKTQPWAKGFHRGSFIGYRAKVDTHTLCEILRYCDKMSRLKMFW